MGDLEKLAQWMLSESIPTGHGDDMEGLLEELAVWVTAQRESASDLSHLCGAAMTERDRYRAALENLECYWESLYKRAAAERDHYQAALKHLQNVARLNGHRAMVRYISEELAKGEALGDE